MKPFSVRFNHPKNTWELFNHMTGNWYAISAWLAGVCFDFSQTVYVKGLS